MSGFSYSTDNVEVYRVRGQHGQWADIVIDDQGSVIYGSGVRHRGQIFINSDFGSWSHHWGHLGQNIKQWLITAEDEYLMNKMSRRDYFDLEATKAAFMHILDERFRFDSIGKDLYDTLKFEVEGAEWGSPNELYHDMSDDLVNQFDPSDLPYVMTYEPGIAKFFEAIMPEFRKILSNEIKSNISKQSTGLPAS